jgi:hypothetical protein
MLHSFRKNGIITFFKNINANLFRKLTKIMNITLTPAGVEAFVEPRRGVGAEDLVRGRADPDEAVVLVDGVVGVTS